MAKATKRRKMLGDPNGPLCREMMRQIETQSRDTLANWALDFAQKRYEPIFLEQRPEDLRMQQLLALCQAVQAGQVTRKEEKAAIQAARKALGELAQEPVAEAAARAIVTACGVYQTPTNALGFLFYGAAAVVYHQEGLSQTAEYYEERAQREWEEAIQSLKEVSVAAEPNPVKVDWNC